MSCKSCGGNDHSRSSSHLCPNKKKDPLRDIPEEKEGFYRFEEFSVVKIGMNKICKNKKDLEKINTFVRNATEICFRGSRKIQYEMLKELENNKDPDLNRTLIRQILVSSSKDLVNMKGMTQIITILTKEYKVNFDLYLDKQQSILIKQLFLNYCERKNITKFTKQMWSEILTSSEKKDYNDQNDLLDKFIYLLKIKPNLKSIYDLMKELIKQGLNIPTTLVPLYTSDAKYITIDTDVLAAMRNKTPSTFRQNDPKNEWFKFIKINKHLKNKFDFQLKTDGIGCSLIMKKNVYKSKIKEKYNKEDFKNKKIQEKMEKLKNKTILIGVDVGSKSIATCVRLDKETGEFENLNLSSKEYYHSSKMNERIRRSNNHLQFNNLETWIGAFPSFKTISSLDSHQKTNEIINHENFKQLLNVKCSKGYKRLRWNVYINKNKTVNDFCSKLINSDKVKDIVICYGDADYSNELKGNRCAPRRLWLKRHLEKIRHVDCIDIREFNTSKVCSKCFASKKLVACNTAKNPYSVRKCTICQTIWNRDVNAARNILILGDRLPIRPLLFSKRIID